MSLLITVTSPAGVVTYPKALTYRIEDARYNYSTMTFRVASTNTILINSQVKVTGPNSEVPFLGYVKSVLPSTEGVNLISCASYSQLLIERGPWPQTYATNLDIADMLTSDPPAAGNDYTRGLLFDCNSLFSRGAATFISGYSDYTYYYASFGTSSRFGAIPATSVYKGTAVLTKSAQTNPVNLELERWMQTEFYLWLRFTTNADLFTYPISLVNYKDTHLRYGGIHDYGENDPAYYNANPIVVDWPNNAWGVMTDIFRTNGLDWRFENNIDGYSYLYYGWCVGNGEPSWWSELGPAITLIEGDNLLSYEIGYRDVPNALTMVYSTGVLNYTKNITATGQLRERIVSELTFIEGQARGALYWDMDHKYISWYIRTKSVEDPALMIGDWVMIQLSEGDPYEVRIESKVLENGVMWLTCIVDENGWA